MSENAQKRLRLMTYWLFGSVLIIWAAVLTYVALWVNPLINTGESSVGYLFSATWQFDLVILVVAVAIYAVYRWVLLPRSS